MLLTPVLLISGLAGLVKETKELSSGYYAESSKSTRLMQIRKYLSFIDEFGGLLSPVPCASAQVALYVTWLARSLKYSSITNYLSALNYMLKSEGAVAIDYQDFKVKSVLRGAKRKLGVKTRQAAPLLPSHLLAIFKCMSDTPGHVAARAALLTSFRGLLRKSQITESDSVLRRGDFTFFVWGMVITIRKYKTIQFSERELVIPVSRVSNTDLCAVFWCERHFAQTPIVGPGPAFQVPSASGGSVPLSYASFQSTLKYFCAKIGLDPVDFSSHSLRRGGCTFLASQGASIQELKARGDWKSDCVYQYIQTSLSDRILFDTKVAAVLASMT